MILLHKLIDWINKEIIKNTRREFLVIWISGISLSISIVESTYFRIEGYADSFKNWIMLWIMMLIMGIFVGIIGYYIKGAFLYLGVRLAGGKGSYKSARTTIVYSGLPIYIVVILIEIANMFIYFNDYFTANSSIVLDVIWMILRIISTIVFFIVLVKISRNLFNTRIFRSILILCIVPIVYNLFTLLTDDKYTNEWTKLYKIIPLHF